MQFFVFSKNKLFVYYKGMDKYIDNTHLIEIQKKAINSALATHFFQYFNADNDKKKKMQENNPKYYPKTMAQHMVEITTDLPEVNTYIEEITSYPVNKIAELRATSDEELLQYGELNGNLAELETMKIENLMKEGGYRRRKTNRRKNRKSKRRNTKRRSHTKKR